MINEIDDILKVCGPGSYLHIGCGNDQLTFDLLKRSMDAYGLDTSTSIIQSNLERAPERFFVGSLAEYPFEPQTFDTIIIGSEILRLGEEALRPVFAKLREAAKRQIVLYMPATARQGLHPRQPQTSRLFWEQAAVDGGFRRHPRSMLACSFAELEEEGLETLTFFERIPDAALARYPMDKLLADRDLHMDMLREAGRRSDGHVSRYAHAATLIRPGDTVLDAACGLGYGTAVMAACSNGANFIGLDIDAGSADYATANFSTVNPAIEYRAQDVTDLSQFEDNSIDTVVSFETIEHLPDYEPFLQEVARVLRPDGRFIGSVPNMWCDETGEDPNPHHFHVFDWHKLNEAVGKHLIVDGRLHQTAGGGFKLPEFERAITPIPVDEAFHDDTEWWLITAVKDPTAGELANLPYSNHFRLDSSQSLPTLIRFEDFYDNPWLYRTIVQLGERIADRSVLIDFCAKVAGEARPGSADQGAALCVLAYQLFESGYITSQAVTSIVQGINDYVAALDDNNPHAYRWSLSLHYVGGRLLLAMGKREEALAALLACAEMDPLRFSPLLATKTISSRMYAGLIYSTSGKIEEAREQFALGVKEAHRVMQGDWSDLLGSIDEPLPFGLTEGAEVLEIASQCANALHALENGLSVPGHFWDRANLKKFGLASWAKDLERENADLRRKLADSEDEDDSQKVSFG